MLPKYKFSGKDKIRNLTEALIQKLSVTSLPMRCGIWFAVFHFSIFFIAFALNASPLLWTLDLPLIIIFMLYFGSNQINFQLARILLLIFGTSMYFWVGFAYGCLWERDRDLTLLVTLIVGGLGLFVLAVLVAIT